jgi:hypothetical protein
MDTTDGELKSSSVGSGFGLSFHFSSFTSTRHDFLFESDKKTAKNFPKKSLVEQVENYYILRNGMKLLFFFFSPAAHKNASLFFSLNQVSVKV